MYISTPRRAFCVCRPSSEITLDNEQGSHGASSVHMTKHFYDVHLRHHLILRHVMVRHIIVLMCHVCGIYVFVSSCKCYSRLVNVCHGFVPSCFCYFCHSNVFHAHACHAIVCHAIVTSCKCLSCKRDHVNERHTSASSRVPRWLRFFYFKVSAGVFVYQHLPQKNNIQNIATGTKDPRPECFFPITAELSVTPMPLYSTASLWCCHLSLFFNRLHLIAHSWAGQKVESQGENEKA